MVLQGEIGFGDDEVAYQHPFTCFDRSFESPARGSSHSRRFPDEQANHDGRVKTDHLRPNPSRWFSRCRPSNAIGAS
jgi:hypothetical protein